MNEYHELASSAKNKKNVILEKARNAGAADKKCFKSHIF